MNAKTDSKETENTEELVEADALADLNREEVTKLRRRALLRRFWRSASHYWKEDGGRLAWLLTGVLLVIILLSLATSYGMNVWNRAIFDALQNRDGATVLWLSMLYVLLLVASVVVAIALVFARMTIQRRWRKWLSTNLLDRWLHHGRYYQLNLISGDHQNPEYRIADDVRVATEAPVDFATGVTDRSAVGNHVHRCAMDDRRRADRRDRWQQHHNSGLPSDRGSALRHDRQCVDGAHRSALRRSVGKQKSV